MHIKLFILLIFFIPAASHAGDPPPVGQRKYLIPEGRAEKPSKIVGIKTPTGASYMKDPIRTGIKSADELVKKAKKPAKPKKIGIKPAQLQFSSVAIGGKLSQPRVDFLTERLTLDRADEPYEINYLERLRTTVEDSEKGF